jgi:hypothetical protein
MSAMQPEGSVGHEWEADRPPHCGLAPGVVNVAWHLWRVSLGQARDPLQWFPFDTLVVPC